MFKKVYLSYNSDLLQDGYFSQLQRQFAIYSIAKKYKFSFHFSPISSITLTHLDQFKTIAQANFFISKCNQIYNLGENSSNNLYRKIIEIHSPSLFSIFWFGFKNYFSSGKLLIKIVIPYKIIEKSPEIYSLAINRVLPNINLEKKKFAIVMHIRRGVSESHIVPGEKFSRSLNSQYYINVLRHILEHYSISKPISLTILTDAPEDDMQFKVISEQIHLQKEFNYLKNSEGIRITGHSFSDIKEYFLSETSGEIEIIRGGDAQKAISMMMAADYLVMSRSSMSYIGALLNTTGTVFYPPNFWHKPIRKWVKVSNFIDN